MSAWKMPLFMLTKVPGAWWFGLRVQHLDEQVARVSVPYKWRTQNPFRSIYFVAQCAAAEMSTALHALAHLQQRKQVAMLVVSVNSTYTKKANALTTFECRDGERIRQAIDKAIETGEAQTCTALAIGTMPDGTEVSRIEATWSFKTRS